MLEMSRVRNGRWEAIWDGADDARIAVLHQGEELTGLTFEATGDGKWRLSLPLPPELLSDGVQTFVIREGGETVGKFTIVTGTPLEDDLRAEIDLLRAELDLLKKAFRRHCVETGAA